MQVEDMDQELRSRLWNALHIAYWDNCDFAPLARGKVEGSNLKGLIYSYWHGFFKQPIDSIPYKFEHALKDLREQCFGLEWFEVYDFVEFTIATSDYHNQHRFASSFPKICNTVLEEENAGYRIVEGQVAQITSHAELESIEAALSDNTPFTGAKEHLASALSLLADREQPDYRNSIKESISAVESACKVLAQDKDATLGQALGVLESHMNLHGALKTGFASLYGYTSDADGIRHAMLKKSSVTFADAKYMLVSCTAFINYIVSKSADLEIPLIRES